MAGVQNRRPGPMAATSWGRDWASACRHAEWCRAAPGAGAALPPAARPIQHQLLCHRQHEPEPAAEQRWRQVLLPYYAEFVMPRRCR